MKGLDLGIGLVIGGAALGAVGALWLLATLLEGSLRAGGFVLGLFLFGLFAVPMILAGLSMRARAARESVETGAFEIRRRVLDRDRVFRTSFAAQLDEASRALAGARRGVELAVAATRLRTVAAELARPVERTSWLESADVADEDRRALEQYDDVLTHDARSIVAALRDPSPDPAAVDE